MPHAMTMEQMLATLNIHDNTLTRNAFIAQVQHNQAQISTENKTERATIDEALQMAAALLYLWHDNMFSLADVRLVVDQASETEDNELFVARMACFYMLRYPDENTRPTIPSTLSYENQAQLRPTAIKQWVRNQYLTLDQALKLTPGQKSALLDHSEVFEWAYQNGHIKPAFFTMSANSMKKALYHWQRTQNGTSPWDEAVNQHDFLPAQPVQFTLENLMKVSSIKPNEPGPKEDIASNQPERDNGPTQLTAQPVTPSQRPAIFRLTQQAAAFQKDTLSLLETLISNIENKQHYRWTSGHNSPKVKMLHVLKNYIEDRYYLHRECLEDPEQQAAILSTLLAICQINRNWDSFWKTPHSVIEFQDHFKTKTQTTRPIETITLTASQKEILLTGAGLGDLFKDVATRYGLNP